MYLYFDNKGILKTKIDHGEKVRQGSPLKVTVCLNTDFFDNLCHVYGYDAKYKHIYNWGLSVDLCKNGEHDPFSNQSVLCGEKKTFIKEYDGEVTYDLQNFEQYIMYDITIPANQSTQLGTPFEMVFTLFTAPLAETDDKACDCPVCHPTSGSEEVTDSYSHKLAVVFVEVEKTFGQVSYKVTVSQYQNMLNTIRSFAQQYTIDEEPLDDSDHLVKSGGVKSALDTLDDKIDEVDERLDDKIDEVDERLDDKIDEVDERLDNKIDSVNNTLDDKIDLIHDTLDDKIDEVDGRLDTKINNLVESHTAIQNISGTLSVEQINTLFNNYPDGIYRINSEEFGPETIYIHHQNVDVEGDQDYFKRYTASYAYAYDFDLNDWQIASGAGGGGGGGTGSIILTARSALTQTVALGAETILRFFYRSEASSTGTAYLYADQVLKQSKTIIKGENSFDVTDLVKSAPTSFRVVVNDIANNSASLTFVVSSVELKITSTFDDTLVKEGQTIQFVYTPYGGEEKTVHYILDGVDKTETITASGSDSTRTYNITNLTHGVHSFRVYMTSMVGDNLITSNVLSYQIIYNDGVSEDIIIASKFDKTTASEGELISIDYIVYSRQFLNTTVSLSVNGVVQQANILTNRSKKFWNLTNYPTGKTVFTITATDGSSHTASKSFTVAVSQAEINVKPVSNNLVLYLANNNRNNGETEPQRSTWTYGSISSKLTNFNWASNGWVNDEQGYPILRVNGQAKVDIPLKLFESASSFENGKTIEINFKIQDVVNTSNVLMSCFNNSVGFKITSNEFIFNGGGQTITTKFKEEEKIKISLSIQSANSDRLIKTYINGVLSGIVQYEGVSNFIQSKSVNITINPNQDGFIDIYSIRVYNNALSNNDILNNYIADLNTADKLIAYRQNNIFDSFGNVSYAKIKDLIPVLIIEGPLPAVKGDKQTVVCNYEDPLNENNNFYYEGCSIDVQGTSSQYYPRKNYKIKFPQKFSLYEGAVQERSYTFKADFMESSHSHNTGAAKIISELSPANPKQIEGGPAIRNSIYGFPIVIFHRNSPTSPLEYYGVYNFNNDKNNNNTIGLDDNHCESWEFKNNTSPLCLFDSDDFSNTATVEDCFEARYPEFEDGHVNYTNLERVIGWVYSTKNDTATFESEFENYFNKNFCLFYYVMMEVLLAVDSRAKNMFLDTFDGNIWYPRWYDIDTIFGLNNEGVLDFSYDLEQHDTKGTGNVYNGEASVFWNNFETVFADDIKAYYNNLRSNGLDYNYILSVIKGEQVDKISAAMYNSDSQFKYVESLLFNNENYLYTAQGSRIEHFKWWLQSRFNYLDSKYENANYLNDYVTMRMYTPITGATLSAAPVSHSFNLVPYKGIYCEVKFGSTTVKQRGHENVQTTVDPPQNINFNDTETIIYGASQLLSLGNLYNKYAGSMNLANATRIKDLNIGHSSSYYENTNLTELTLGNNELLQTIDVRGCTNLAGTLNLSGCRSIKTIYANRTALTYIRLPEEGGNLTTLYLPETIQTLVIKDQPFLNSFSLPSCANLQTVELKNTPILTPDLIQRIANNAPNLTSMILTNIDWTLSNSYVPVFNTLAAPSKKITINGRIHITGTVYEDNLNAWNTYFGNNVIITADDIIPTGDETKFNVFIDSKQAGQSLQFGTISSAGKMTDIVSVDIVWGDGTSTVVRAQSSSYSYYYYLTHTYEEAGTYTIQFVLYYITQPSETIYHKHTLNISTDYITSIDSFQSLVYKTISFSGNGYNLKKIAPFPSSITSLTDFNANIGTQVSSEDNELDISFVEPESSQGLYISGTFGSAIKSVVLRSDTDQISVMSAKNSNIYTVLDQGRYLSGKFTEKEKGDRLLLGYTEEEASINRYYALVSEKTPGSSSNKLSNFSTASTTRLIHDNFPDAYNYIGSLNLNNGLLYIGDNFLHDNGATGNGGFWTPNINPTSVNVPGTVKKIGNDFITSETYSHSLNTVTLGEGLTFIKGITQRPNIISIEIPASLTTWESGAFYGSYNAYLSVNNNNTVFDSRNDCNAIIRTQDNTIILGSNVTDFSLATDVTTIASNAFGGVNLADKALPRSIITLANRAFTSCTNGNSIQLTYIKNIGQQAFEISGLTEGTNGYIIPGTLENISNFAFSNTFSGVNVVRIESGITALPMGCFAMSKMRKIILSNTITSLGDSIFAACPNLEEIVLSDNITVIPNSAFSSTRPFSLIGESSTNKLVSIELPAGLKSIDVSAFYGCEYLEEITIPEGVTTLSTNTFNMCSSLQSVTCKGNITRLGSSCFYGCVALTTVSFGLVPEISSIPSLTFYNCSSLLNAILPASITTIGSSAFDRCTGITNLTIASNITSIGGEAFARCTGINSVLIESSNKPLNISSSCFMGCTNLMTITINRYNAPTIGNNVFPRNVGLKIKVPYGRRNHYIQQTNWNTYSNYIEEQEEE